ncbi:MAG: minichromosome maintenance protein MCM [Candidatus Anstonellales archaeon]
MHALDFESFFDRFFSNAYINHVKLLMANFPKKKSLNIDWHDIERYDQIIADEILKNPEQAIEGAKAALRNFAEFSRYGNVPNPRFYNLPQTSSFFIESIGSKHINQLISFKGLVSRRGEALNKARILFYKCSNCEEIFKIIVDENFVKPNKCKKCNKGSLRQMTERSSFIDYQRIEVQDLLERVMPGTQAAKIYCIVEDDLVNYVVPGDNVEITGVLKINQSRAGNNLFSNYVEVVHINKLKKEFEELDITNEDREKIHNFAKSQDVTNEIAQLIAPDIYGYDEIKIALALQLFGGTKDKVSPAGMQLRDNIHVLLIGDPGIAKTKFLQEVCSIAPKSIYVSGKGVSGAGLTATAEKDELSGGGWTLKAGALVLASGGIAAIDEFDKIDDTDRAALHEVMESGKISMAKAGIVATFKAKTSILAAANPKLGRFIDSKNITEQFNIPPSLLTRFDLIFPIRDISSEEKDRKLARHILNLHLQSKNESDEQIKEKKIFIRKYIAYARTHINPRLTKEAMEELENFYTEMRRAGEKTGTVAITPRYLEGIIRIAEAHAKMRLSHRVELRDVEVAIKLMKKMLYEIMTDKETGVLDVDIIHSGVSAKQRDLMNFVISIIQKLQKEYDSVERRMVIEEARHLRPDVDENKINEIIEKAKKEGLLYEPGHGLIKIIETD